MQDKRVARQGYYRAISVPAPQCWAVHRNNSAFPQIIPGHQPSSTPFSYNTCKASTPNRPKQCMGFRCASPTGSQTCCQQLWEVARPGGIGFASQEDSQTWGRGCWASMAAGRDSGCRGVMQQKGGGTGEDKFCVHAVRAVVTQWVQGWRGQLWGAVLKLPVKKSAHSPKVLMTGEYEVS